MNELEFKVGLGNSISTDLNIVSLTPNENFPISIEYESGTFDLSDYCENGDEIRLFDPTGRLILYQNTPNPAAETTQINFEILENGFTKLYITDILGRNVLNIVESNLVSGEYSYEIDLTNIPVGSYNYILETSTQRVVKRMDVNK